MKLLDLIEQSKIAIPMVCVGKVESIKGSSVIARMPTIEMGDYCWVEKREGARILTKAMSFQGNLVLLMPFASLQGLHLGSKVTRIGQKLSIRMPVSEGLVIDPFGQILKSSREPEHNNYAEIPLMQKPPSALQRSTIKEQFRTGIRSIDALCPIGKGQRLGLFAGPGIGKSTLLATIAKNSCADVNVVALVGERGREAGEFIENTLGSNGLKRSIVVISTADEPATIRSLAAVTAISIAEYHRNQGKSVFLLVDSLTRVARAIRDIHLAYGEQVIRQGLTPSVFTELALLLERAGNDDKGSITALYSVLDQSENEPDPLSAELKSLLDGHICLSSKLALSGIRPAIDFTNSISRLAGKLQDPHSRDVASIILQAISRLSKDKELVLLGGYADPELERYLKVEKEIQNFINQSLDEDILLEHSLLDAQRLAEQLGTGCENITPPLENAKIQ